MSLREGELCRTIPETMPGKGTLASFTYVGLAGGDRRRLGMGGPGVAGLARILVLVGHLSFQVVLVIPCCLELINLLYLF